MILPVLISCLLSLLLLLLILVVPDYFFNFGFSLTYNINDLILSADFLT